MRNGNVISIQAAREVLREELSVLLRSRAWWFIRQNRHFVCDRWCNRWFVGNVGADTARLRNGLCTYIAKLESAGIVTRVERRNPGVAAWRLERDLGRQAPVWRAAQKALFDPNSGALIPLLAIRIPSHLIPPAPPVPPRRPRDEPPPQSPPNPPQPDGLTWPPLEAAP